MVKKCLRCKSEFEGTKRAIYCSMMCRLRFHSKETESGCWECDFKSRDKDGYTSIKFWNGKTKLTHRLMYETFHNKEIPDGLHICHHCDNPCCINPDHLFAGTRSDNMKDCARKGRLADHKGSKNFFHVLTEDDVVKIKKLVYNGEKIRSIAEAFSVSYDTIRMIKLNRTWRHVA